MILVRIRRPGEPRRECKDGKAESTMWLKCLRGEVSSDRNTLSGVEYCLAVGIFLQGHDYVWSQLLVATIGAEVWRYNSGGISSNVCLISDRFYGVRRIRGIRHHLFQ